MGLCTGISRKWLFIHCFQIKLEFRSVDFCGGRKTREAREKPSYQGWEPTTNLIHMTPSPGIDRNWTWTTLVGGKCSHHCNIPAPQIHNACGSVKLNKRKFTAHLISMGIKDVLVGDRIITLGKFFQSNNESLFRSTCPWTRRSHFYTWNTIGQEQKKDIPNTPIRLLTTKHIYLVFQKHLAFMDGTTKDILFTSCRPLVVSHLCAWLYTS